MLGYTREELKGKTWQDITPAEDIELTQNKLDSLFQGKNDLTRFNKRYTHKNGSYIWADISIATHRDIHRKPLFFITTIIDITERTKMEEKLRENERKLRESARNGASGFMDLEREDGGCGMVGGSL